MATPVSIVQSVRNLPRIAWCAERAVSLKSVYGVRGKPNTRTPRSYPMKMLYLLILAAGLLCGCLYEIVREIRYEVFVLP